MGALPPLCQGTDTSTATDRSASLYLPWGAPPVGMALASDYGAVPFSAFVQAAIYD